MLALAAYLLQPFKCIFRGTHVATFFWFLIRHGRRPRLQAVTGVRCNGFKLDIADGPSFVWQYKDIFVDQSYRFVSSAPSPVIFDCGANVGCSVLYFKMLYPQARITAFEADAAIFDLLLRNVQANGLSDVHCVNEAVWVNGEGVVFARDGADGGAIAAVGKSVSSVRLADKIAAETVIDLLKIDIEGAETEVLIDCAAVLDRVQNIFIEFHSWQSGPQVLSRLLEVLERQGFRYYLENVGHRSTPLITRPAGAMDMQTNIYGYRV